MELLYNKKFMVFLFNQWKLCEKGYKKFEFFKIKVLRKNDGFKRWIDIAWCNIILQIGFREDNAKWDEKYRTSLFKAIKSGIKERRKMNRFIKERNLLHAEMRESKWCRELIKNGYLKNNHELFLREKHKKIHVI
jgi:hypothetical protein